jgi:hypothetical protein
MKKKIIALLLIGTFCLSLTACGGGVAKTSQDSNFEKKVLHIEDDAQAESDEEAGDEDDYQLEIPDAITNISPEDDQALTGVLTEDAYRNDYFGITINKIEGGTIESLMDSGTDIMPLSETYTNGNGCIMISTRSAYNECSISMTVSAVTSKDQGKKEEDLAQERYDLEQGINEAMGYKAECAVETINIAGEDHHAYTEISNTEGGRAKSATVCIIKGDFQSNISIYAPEDQFEEVLKYIEGN